MIKLSKQEIIEIVKLDPSFLIEKEIMLKGTDKHSVKIKRISINCEFILVSRSNSVLQWINVNNLEDEILIDISDFNKPVITLNNILSMIKEYIWQK